MYVTKMLEANWENTRKVTQIVEFMLQDFNEDYMGQDIKTYVFYYYFNKNTGPYYISFYPIKINSTAKLY